MAEVWFRNPLTYIRECAELAVTNIAWDRGLLQKNRIDPIKHAEAHLASVVQYRILLIGDQGTAELRRGHDKSNPFAVYPTWEYGAETIGRLERMLATQELPSGATPDECGVEGQEHRVVVIRPPNANTSPGKAFISLLRELQFEYPKAIIHYHGTYSFRVAFGQGFGAADIDPVSDSAKGRIVLGSGRKLAWEDAAEYTTWIALSGFRHSELAVARNRTMFNMKSAQWAALNFDEQDAFRVRPGNVEVDTQSAVPVTLTTRKARGHRAKAADGDKFLCDRCSLAPTCRYQREGGVCVIPDSETSGLARYFKSRDSDEIIDGLGRLMEKKIARAERGMAFEEAAPDEPPSPEVTRILKDVFDSGVKLAKLVNPNLAGGTKVGVFVNGVPAGQVGSGAAVTEAALVSAAVAELEAKRIDRADIDAEMVTQYIIKKNRTALPWGAIDV